MLCIHTPQDLINGVRVAFLSGLTWRSNQSYVKFKILTEMTVNVTVFCYVTPTCIIYSYQWFGRMCCLCLQDWWIHASMLKMAAASFSSIHLPTCVLSRPRRHCNENRTVFGMLPCEEIGMLDGIKILLVTDLSLCMPYRQIGRWRYRSAYS
jgi:hypothetical protein